MLKLKNRFKLFPYVFAFFSVIGMMLLNGFAPSIALSAGEPVKIRMAVALGTTISQFMLMVPELLKHNKKSYDLELVQYFASSAQIPVLAAEKIDIGWLDWSNMSSAVINGGLDIKIIADLNQDKDPYWSNAYAVLDVSPYKNPADLKGKTIGVGAFGGIPDFVVREIMKKYGLEYPKDYNMVEVQLPTMEAMLRDGKIDCGNFLNNIWYRAQQKGGLRILFTHRDVFNPGQEIMHVARTEFIKKHRDALVDLMEDLIRVTRWFWNPANHKEAVRLASQRTKVPESAWEPWAFTKMDSYKSPDCLPNMEAIAKGFKWFYENKYVSRPVDINRYSDLTMVIEAKQRLESGK